MTHAFLIIAHDQPQLLERTMRLLESPNHYFFCVFDSKSQCLKELKTAAHKFKNTLYTNSQKINWGGYSQIKAALMLLKAAFYCSIQFDYFHLMSGSDFPCCSNIEFDKFFEEHNGVSWLAYDPIQDSQSYLNRINRYYLNDYFNVRHGKRNRIRIYAERAINTFFRRNKPEFILHKGTNWFSLHLQVVSYTIDFLEENSNYTRRFRFSNCADELFFHTMLYSKAKELNINTQTHLRYINWHPKRPYKGGLPLTLEAIDYDDIISSHPILCRKVNQKQSAELLDRLVLYINS